MGQLGPRGHLIVRRKAAAIGEGEKVQLAELVLGVEITGNRVIPGLTIALALKRLERVVS